jgi:O-antigen/teichoic acid export membrane protein
LFFFVSALLKSGLMPLRMTVKAFKKLFTFGFVMMLSWLVSTLLFTSDLWLVARFGSDYDLGVYSVYQNTIRGLCTILFHDVFAVVFLPMIAALNKRHVDRMILKHSLTIFGVIWIGAAAMTTLLILLYGKAFPLDWTYVGLTSAGIAMNMMYLLFTSVISLDGVKAARLAFAALVIPIPVLLFLQYLFIKHWGMIGGMTSVIALNVMLLIAFRLTIRLFYRVQSAPEKGAVSN